jgi:hypothetical protein
MPDRAAIPGHHLVAIAAAVAAALGADARILDIQAAGFWARMGRRAVQSSHNLLRGPNAIRSLARPDPGANRR